MHIPEYPILFLLPAALLDDLILYSGKHVLIQFLDGVVNIKKRGAFHRKQKFSDRLTLNYLPPLVKKKYAREFHPLHQLYRFYLYSILPQYILAVLLRFLFVENGLVPVLWGLLIIRIIISAIFWLQEDSCHQLKCIQKKKRP